MPYRAGVRSQHGTGLTAWSMKMYIDMGQADSTLRMRPISDQRSMCWSVALQTAAKSMGFDHYMDVPSERDEELRSKAHSIRGTVIE